MMDPPASDRPLDAAAVRRVLREQLPDLPLRSVEHLGSGWEHDVYVADERWVFRFPRYAEVAAHLDHDIAVHELVRTTVRDAFAVPVISFHGLPGTIFPHRFVGHLLVPGVGADDVAAPPSPVLATDLGRALSAIHAIPAAAARRIGVGDAGADCAGPLDALMRQLQHVPALRDAAPDAHEWLATPPVVPRAFAGPPRFLHNDLHPEHIIVDARTGHLSGIVDWSGAALGDPSIDFAFVMLLGGAAFVDAALASYALPIDPALRERIVFRARVRAIGWLADALRRGIDPARSLAEVRRAFEPH